MIQDCAYLYLYKLFLHYNWHKQASEKLVKLGYTSIVEFGGINDWTGETVSGEA